MRDPPDRPLVSGCCDSPLDVRRMNDHTACMAEHLADEREPFRIRLPHRRQNTVDDAEGYEAASETRIALERFCICPGVAATERGSRNEMVEHEVVQNDDTGPASQPTEDPPVGVSIVADVVEDDVCPARPASPVHDVDIGQSAQGREEKGAVVRNAGMLRRKR
jgi:hypothetical protein